VVATDLRGSFFGLSELFVFSGERNVALGARVAALDRIGSNLNWSPAHLTDGYSTLGLPTGEASNRRGCFRSAPLSSESEPSWLEVRLLEEQELSAISLVPAAWIPNLARIQHLGEGFPAAFRIEVASGDGPWVGVFEHRAEERHPFPNPCNVMWSLALPEGIRADRIRITATRHVYNEVASAYYFALGEVQVLDGAGRNVALGARVECAHPGRDGNAFRVENAVDGFSSDGSLMGLREWLKALNRRRVVQLEIADLETALREWMLRRERTWRSLGWGAGLAVSGAAGLHFWGLRRGRLRREAALRERIAQDLHDEIGSTLGSISLYADGLARRASGPDQGRLAQVAEMAREASQTMRDLVWVVDERSDDSGQLFERLRETAMRQVADMPLQFEAPEGEKAVRVSPDQKRHLLLFLKEALHNVIRHAAASQVRVRIESEGAYWVLEVGDDGRGFEPECPGGSQLEKLRARAARLGGQLEVESRRGAGTRLRLRIPCRIADA
ncbi:MAG: hypothetical protein RLZZ244_974, partial [Verrucomicrobiota bacterium]